MILEAPGVGGKLAAETTKPAAGVATCPDEAVRRRGRRVANILSIQSQVVFGHVGNAAAQPALQRLGHEVWALPTALLSHHPGHARPAGRILPADELAALADSLEARGLWPACGGLLSGWLGGLETAELVLRLAARIRAANPDLVWLCDPVIGDLPKGIYVEPALVDAFRDRLLPAAGIATPNRFELELLSGLPVRTLREALAAARVLLARGTGCIVCTSLQREDGPPDAIETLAVTEEGGWLAQTPRLNGVPQGSGDLFAAVFLGRCLQGRPVRKALAFATAATYGVLRASVQDPAYGRLPRELALVAAQAEINRPSFDPWVQQVA